MAPARPGAMAARVPPAEVTSPPVVPHPGGVRLGQLSPARSRPARGLAGTPAGEAEPQHSAVTPPGSRGVSCWPEGRGRLRACELSLAWHGPVSTVLQPGRGWRPQPAPVPQAAPRSRRPHARLLPSPTAPAPRCGSWCRSPAWNARPRSGFTPRDLPQEQKALDLPHYPSPTPSCANNTLDAFQVDTRVAPSGGWERRLQRVHGEGTDTARGPARWGHLPARAAGTAQPPRPREPGGTQMTPTPHCLRQAGVQLASCPGPHAVTGAGRVPSAPGTLLLPRGRTMP